MKNRYVKEGQIEGTLRVCLDLPSCSTILDRRCLVQTRCSTLARSFNSYTSAHLSGAAVHAIFVSQDPPQSCVVLGLAAGDHWQSLLLRGYV